MGKNLEESSHNLLEVQSWTTLEGLTDHYENQPRYLLFQLPLHLPARIYNRTSGITDVDALHVAERDAIILNYFQVTNSGLDAAKT
jgi:hypothetical protein